MLEDRKKPKMRSILGFGQNGDKIGRAKNLQKGSTDMKMTFSEFAKLLYNHIGNRCGTDVFTYDLLTNILDPASNTILEELQPDTKKDGGKYMTYTGNFRFYDAEKRVMKFVDGMVIGVGQVCWIEMK